MNKPRQAYKVLCLSYCIQAKAISYYMPGFRNEVGRFMSHGVVEKFRVGAMMGGVRITVEGCNLLRV